MQRLAGHDDPSPSFSADTPENQDQREADRLRLLMRTAKLVTAQGEFLCVLRDASVGGFRARIFHPLPSDGEMELELASAHRYPIEKVWEKDNEAGFRFTEKIALEELVNELTPYPKRGVRLNLDLETDIQVGDQRARATLENLSQQGARIDTLQPLAQAQRLLLNITGMRAVTAQVRWRDGDTYGLAFEDTFQFDELALLVYQLQRQQSARKGIRSDPAAPLRRIDLR